MSATVLSPLLPEQAGRCKQWARLYGSSAALAIVSAANRHQGLAMVVVADEQQAYWLESELNFFAAGQQLPVFHFPDWETLPYDIFSPAQDVVSERLATLIKLPELKRGILLVTVAALMQRLPPQSYLDASVFMLETGDIFDMEGMREKLQTAGYECVDQVIEHGQYAVRGSLFDVFPMGSKKPYRIDLFDEEIDSIRDFDPDTQRSDQTHKRIKLLPAREYPLTAESVSAFRQSFRTRFDGKDLQHSPVYTEISASNAPGGIEYFLPLFYKDTATLFDYLPGNGLIIQFGHIEDAAHNVWEQTLQRYGQRSLDVNGMLLEPAELFLTAEQMGSLCEDRPLVYAQRYKQDDDKPSAAAAVNYDTLEPPSLQINLRAEEPTAALRQFLSQYNASNGRALFVADSAGRREMLTGLLKEHHVSLPHFETWRDFQKADAPLGITVAQLENGLLLEEPKFCVIAESQLFGEKARAPKRRKRVGGRDPNALIKELTDLSIGALVVHDEHGIGRYRGLKTLEIGGVSGEFLTLEYAEEESLYVPVQSLDLISRYTGAADENARLHKLGSGQWEKARKKAAAKARDVAAELLDIYARRAASKGHAFGVNENEYQAFIASFPFEETDDQITAVEAISADMVNSQPMDRVVCGDVGFGKTEVAMRAAFIAANNGKQVAVLAPTTLLVQQHYQNFLDRFANWPFKVDVLSRFRTQKEKNITLAGIEDGTVDIVIGTHALIQSKTNFKNLGLVIVDEEQRFGVTHKEQLKKLRAEVDMLTLTATPIPRTLNMALSGMRDLSIIATPPANRLSVKTFVNQWNDAVIVEACQRELRRGGQIYFLHNKVDNIEKTTADLQALIPEARVRFAHGQMREQELEQTMLDFSHRRFDILVCTTIVESGIDVPNANTMIINRADKLGLSQLHQLRGRVGRSHHRAYCYLIVPSPKLITKDGQKRLEAIESLDSLGAGFSLATHDLEIRGAGELLGDEQSGQISEVGFSMYTELLERAVKALKSGENPELDEPLGRGPEVNLHLPALLPSDYVQDVHSRLMLYKRISNAKDKAEIKELTMELIDRFGLLPDEAKTLFAVSEMKIQARKLGIVKLDAWDSGGRIVFNDKPNIDPMQIIQLIQSRPNTYKFNGKDTLRFEKELEEPEKRYKWVETLLDTLDT